MGLRLPSLGEAFTAALGTLRRFPLVLGAAAVATLAAVLTAEELGSEALRDRLLAAATLGLPLLTAVALANEQQPSRPRRLAAQLAALLVLLAVYLDWPGWTERARFLRYAQLSAALHLLVAFLPFGRSDRPVAFWQYNRALFTRFVIAGVSSGTLFAGLALALGALDKLFGVDVPESGYARLWFVSAFIFNTWFFLGGLPKDLATLEERRPYPVELRVFAQYTLVPLVSLYLVILMFYFAKVLVMRDWPQGWIGLLVSGVASTGILALLLVHPLAEEPEQKWIATFARDFWIGLLPAVIMLWLALYQRIHQYGVTEPRYFLLALSLWLAAVAGWFALSRSRGIRVIPISLCLVALATFPGPWGAYSVAQKSQLKRLERLLVAVGALKDGRAVKTHGDVAPADLKEISAIVRYEVEVGGGPRLAAWIGDSLARRTGIGPEGWHGGESQARSIVGAFGVRYVGKWESPRSGTRVTFGTSGPRGVLAVRGFDYLVSVRPARDSAARADTALAAEVVPASRAIRVVHGNRALIEIPLDSAIARAMRTMTAERRYVRVADRVLEASAENARARAEAHLTQIEVEGTGTSARVLRSANGQVLVRLK